MCPVVFFTQRRVRVAQGPQVTDQEKVDGSEPGSRKGETVSDQLAWGLAPLRLRRPGREWGMGEPEALPTQTESGVVSPEQEGSKLWAALAKGGAGSPPAQEASAVAAAVGGGGG